MKKTIYYEKQYSSRTKLLYILPIIIIVVIVFNAYWLIRVNYNGNPFDLGSMPTSNLIVIAVLILIVSIVVIIHNSFAHLTLKIDEKGITVNYYPFGQKQLKIGVKEILSYKIRKYSPYKEYRGYGVRENSRRGKAYIIKGREGLHIQLKNGKCLLIGTQKKQAIEYAMKKLMGRENSNKNG